MFKIACAIIDRIKTILTIQSLIIEKTEIQIKNLPFQ